MRKKLKKSIEVAKQKFVDAIIAHGMPTQTVKNGTPLPRVQKHCHTNPVHYNRDSDTRYGDPQKSLGACYVAFSDVVAVAETLQHGQAGLKSPVLREEIEERSLYWLVASRDLIVVDAAALARNAGMCLSAIVGAKGRGSKGYSVTQALSDVVMRYADHIDGILYPSQVYPISGNQAGCNLVLFEGRGQQLDAQGKQPLDDLVLSSGETVGELLIRMQVPIV